MYASFIPENLLYRAEVQWCCLDDLAEEFFPCLNCLHNLCGRVRIRGMPPVLRIVVVLSLRLHCFFYLNCSVSEPLGNVKVPCKLNETNAWRRSMDWNEIRNKERTFSIRTCFTIIFMRGRNVKKKKCQNWSSLQQHHTPKVENKFKKFSLYL